MKDYYSLFVNYSLKLCLKGDYSNKQRVKENNRAADKLYKLQEEMRQIDCKEALATLLRHEDERVKLNAAMLCYKINAYTDEAVQILYSIVANSDDPTISFNAKIILKEYFKIK